ncbi:pentapeptide repeat-containing protein [Mycobacteroides abscessus]|uniref:pentapeptide repeat-containing protein n=1 Tax=Mycobacteroides abscessus TaxID=36809 RepID=UPI00105600E9|nr:hypothetical protein [Mycobacteroides abscessus]
MPIAGFAAVSLGAVVMVVGIPVIRRFAGADIANIDVLKITLTAVSGIGGLVALVVAYRRQSDIERSRFTERYGAAAAQLGSTDPAVRIAGVYAMAGVADESTKFSRRQQCIDVLCGYLRQPYDPQYGSSHHAELVTTNRRLPSESATLSIETTQTERRIFRQNDREVRKTIVRVIADHTRPAAEVSWSEHSFNFDTAILEDADFLDTHFKGDHLSFVESVFLGKYTRFTRATLASKKVWLDRAVFSAETTNFTGCRFGGYVNGFGGAKFHSEHVRFNQAVFARRRRGSETLFLEALFDGDEVTFDGAVFKNATTLLARVLFDCRIISFVGASFTGRSAIFSESQFGLATTGPPKTIALFNHAKFSAKSSVFMNCAFNGKRTSFDWPVEWQRVVIDPLPHSVYPVTGEPVPTTVKCPVIAWVELIEDDNDDSIDRHILHIVNVLTDQPIYLPRIEVKPPTEDMYRLANELRGTYLSADHSWIQDISGGGFNGGRSEILLPKEERTKSFDSPIPFRFFEISITFVYDDRIWSLDVREQEVISMPIDYGPDNSHSAHRIFQQLKSHISTPVKWKRGC